MMHGKQLWLVLSMVMCFQQCYATSTTTDNEDTWFNLSKVERTLDAPAPFPLEEREVDHYSSPVVVVGNVKEDVIHDEDSKTRKTIDTAQCSSIAYDAQNNSSSELSIREEEEFKGSLNGCISSSEPSSSLVCHLSNDWLMRSPSDNPSSKDVTCNAQTSIMMNSDHVNQATVVSRLFDESVDSDEEVYTCDGRFEVQGHYPQSPSVVKETVPKLSSSQEIEGNDIIEIMIKTFPRVEKGIENKANNEATLNLTTSPMCDQDNTMMAGCESLTPPLEKTSQQTQVRDISRQLHIMHVQINDDDANDARQECNEDESIHEEIQVCTLQDDFDTFPFIEGMSYSNDMDELLHSPSSALLSITDANSSNEYESPVGDAIDDVRDQSHGYTTVWGRRRQMMLNQDLLVTLLYSTEQESESTTRTVPSQNSKTLIPDTNSTTSTSESQISDLSPQNTMAVKSVNTDFVEGLDDIDKFLEEVEPPDELDVGAAGSSIQEVLVGKGAQILFKHVFIIISRIRESVLQSRLRQFLASRRTSNGEFVWMTREEFERAWVAVSLSCSNLIESIQNLWDDMFDDGDDDLLTLNVEETSKLNSIRKIVPEQ